MESNPAHLSTTRKHRHQQRLRLLLLQYVVSEVDPIVFMSLLHVFDLNLGGAGISYVVTYALFIQCSALVCEITGLPEIKR